MKQLYELKKEIEKLQQNYYDILYKLDRIKIILKSNQKVSKKDLIKIIDERAYNE